MAWGVEPLICIFEGVACIERGLICILGAWLWDLEGLVCTWGRGFDSGVSLWEGAGLKRGGRGLNTPCPPLRKVGVA